MVDVTKLTNPGRPGKLPAVYLFNICDASSPGMAGDVYHLPYAEAVQGERHGWEKRGRTRAGVEWSHGVQWTRNPNHPPDPRCPECHGPKLPPPTFCNSIAPDRQHSCELTAGHAGKCRQERPAGGYKFWSIEPAPAKEPRVHVPAENLERYRRLIKLAQHVERIGNARSNRGDYAGANRAWSRESRIREQAQTLRVPGRREASGPETPCKVQGPDAPR